MIIFSNPGELDLRLITTFGASLKPGASPIGQFGTGLKYAIAGAVREGFPISINSGRSELHFRATTETIRGQEVQMVEMSEGCAEWKPCGFTAQLGSHWKSWMLFRELYANALDEGGQVTWWTDVCEPCPGTTSISVDGPAFEDIYDNLGDYFVVSKPLWTLPGVLEVHPPSASLVAYKGIRMASSIAGAETAQFTYNLLGHHRLTEDRTLADEYHARGEIARALLQCPDREILEQCLADEPGLEAGIDWDWASQKPGTVLRELGLARIRAKQALPSTLRNALKASAPAELERAETEIAFGSWEEMLAHAPEAPAKVEVPYEIYSVVSSLETALAKANARAKYWEAVARHLAKELHYAV